jgi:hypothetical protein
LIAGGLIGWKVWDRSYQESMFKASIQSELTAITIFEAFEIGKAGEVYDELGGDQFKAGTTREQFVQLVKANPALGHKNETKFRSKEIPSRWVSPRKWTYTCTVTPDRAGFRGDTRKPPPPGTPPVTCTLTLVEVADGWLIDAFTVP